MSCRLGIRSIRVEKEPSELSTWDRREGFSRFQSKSNTEACDKASVFDYRECERPYCKEQKRLTRGIETSQVKRVRGNKVFFLNVHGYTFCA